MQRRITYAPHTKQAFGQSEITAVVQCLEDGWLAGIGPRTEEFERKVAAYFGKKHGLFVNSGSSAVLLALDALGVTAGDEVVTPACTFSTTVAPILQLGATPVFCDVQLRAYVPSVDQIMDKITPKTKCILVPNLVGNKMDWVQLRARTALPLIEDSADCMTHTLETDISTTSFYASHMITAGGGGGMVMFNDTVHLKRATMMRDWGRIGDNSEIVTERFAHMIDGIPYDYKFLYGAPGYNLKSTEMNAAFGLAQLERLDTIVNTRRALFTQYVTLLRHVPQLDLPLLLEDAANGESSSINWLAFPITLSDASKKTRLQVLTALEDAGIQTRVLFSGNITRHPAYRQYLTVFPHADKIMKDSFLIGCHHGMTAEDVQRVCSVLIHALKDGETPPEFSQDWTQPLITSLTELYPTHPKSPVCVVEIGAFEGRGTLEFFTRLISHHADSRIYCVDPWANGTYVPGASDGVLDKLFEHQYATFMKNVLPMGTRIIPMRGTSNEQLPLIPADSVDLVYIDGDHSPAQVFMDAELALRVLKPGGIILFDDYPWTHNGKRCGDGVDKFVAKYSSITKVLFRNYQWAVQVVDKSSYSFWNNPDKVIRHVQQALAKSDSALTSLPVSILRMEGMSGTKTRIFYNELLKTPEATNYFEIGVWKGSSFISAMHNNTHVTGVACDNWSFSQDMSFGYSTTCCEGAEMVFKQNCSTLIPAANVTVLDADAFTLDTIGMCNLPVHVYLYDGGHSVKDHEQALTYFIGALHKYSIFIVDDWNCEEVRVGTHAAFAKLNHAVDIIFKHEYTNGAKGGAGYPDEYWNGIAVYVLCKK
jgi:CDP-4-dehydro-6-deoxyglucose reductase, E1